MSKITYAVVLNPDFTAELRFKEGKSKFVNKIDFTLNSKYALTHIKNRQIVNTILNENNLIVGDYGFEAYDNGIQIIYGKATRLRKETLFAWNDESGFSLLELVITMGIMAILTASAASYLIPAGEKIINNVEEVKAMQEANPDTQYIMEIQ